MKLVLPRGVLDDILAHAREGHPDEVCGLLAGRLGEPRRVERAFRIRNAHPRPRGEYLLDPEEQLRAILHAEDDLGLDVVGFYHSHPVGPPRMSTTDAARATWPGASYFLVWGKPEEGHGSWRWDDGRGRFSEETVEIL